TWPKPVVVAECDPSGGDILAGLFAGHLKAPRGLLGVAFEAGRGHSAIAAELSSQLVPLDDTGNRKFLAGISDPRQALGLSPVWPGIAIALASLEADVIADCGRFDAGATQPLGVLAEAAAVVMVMRPTLRQVAAARPRVEMVSQTLGGRDKFGLLLIGDQGLRPVDIARTLDVRVLASLPDDATTARVLSDGQGRRSRLDRTPLLRAATPAARSIAQLARSTPWTAQTPGGGIDTSGRDAVWTDEHSREPKGAAPSGLTSAARKEDGAFTAPGGEWGQYSEEGRRHLEAARHAGAGGSGGVPPGKQSGGSSPGASSSMERAG
ncbi:MAG TPA: hypothetical protein VN695_17600, partial [Streptosporangiaceae bacterium]|nr:hypothetical protein [Streptosporangiaceae bacterium]